ncbi:hypothetical protein GJ744_010752 [Endocarpon pusillum]|uniref:T6SS Phospholipase effector Tle1-like catalytic domain-containing protein n=1 Tax=Endocarpon pusillum TaxID=364733 RepID=A0A8H7ADW8_9EURO|nr:hypothetical protein GJ744_010752 [Endocarpon pusillum]
MPGRTRSADHGHETYVRSSNRLILCFDGTGNVFQGTPGDTNIVKLYNMFDRTNVSQMHYYQPGIGTYPAEGPVNVSWLRSLMRKFEAVIDSALATSFDSHVIAGYRFIMRHYRARNHIYIFGFSRGAFTARFLSRMISHVGLLSVGNEELVPFAYQVYQKYEQNNSGTAAQKEEHVKFMNSFKRHFCRTEVDAARKAQEDISANESGIKVHFLGLFDCVSSVGNLDIPFFQKTPPLPAVRGTAKHVRHAVAIDERRVKFKAALFSQEQQEAPEDIKEVWFPGNHGDVGGGWDVAAREDGSAHENKDDDYFQLSDIALKWMMDEVDDVEASRVEEPTDRLAWDAEEKANFLRRFQQNKDEMISARMHDTMTWNGGSSNKLKVMLWNFIELLPFGIKRWEYVESPPKSGSYVWDYIGWPPNLGGRRNIPSNALFHHSVIKRMRLSPDPKNYRPKHYVPNNPLWVQASGAHLAQQTNRGTAARDASDQIEVVERNLSELANQYRLEDGADSDHGAQRLVKPRIHFEHAEELTRGSVAIEGRTVVVGAEKWDRIYRVALEVK